MLVNLLIELYFFQIFVFNKLFASGCNIGNIVAKERFNIQIIPTN